MAKVNTTLYGELALIPFQPTIPIDETLAWLTDFIESQDGSEFREARRSMPRQSFGYLIPLQYWKKAEAQNTLYGAIRQDWAIPVWSEPQEVGTITQGDTVINCDTIYRDLRENSLALLYNCNGVFELIEIESKTDTSITLLNPSNGITNAYLVPVRKGFIVGKADIQTSGREGAVRLEFQVDDNLFLEPAEPEQYLGDDIYFGENLLKASDFITRTIKQRQDILDLDLGVISRRTTWDNPKRSIQYNLLLDTVEDVKEYRDFIYRRSGKFRQYWLPSFENDIIVTNVISGGLELIADRDSYVDYSTMRVNIALQDLDGNWYARVIDSVAAISSLKMRLTLNEVLPLQTGEIFLVSFLALNRLDTDRIEMRWINGGNMTSEFSTLEIEP